MYSIHIVIPVVYMSDPQPRCLVNHCRYVHPNKNRVHMHDELYEYRYVYPRSACDYEKLRLNPDAPLVNKSEMASTACVCVFLLILDNNVSSIIYPSIYRLFPGSWLRGCEHRRGGESVPAVGPFVCQPDAHRLSRVHRGARESLLSFLLSNTLNAH